MTASMTISTHFNFFSNPSTYRVIGNKSLATVGAKLLTNQISKRLAAIGTAMAVPGLGGVVAVGMILYDIYTLADFYNKNKTLIDDATSNILKASLGSLTNPELVEKCEERVSSIGRPPHKGDDDEEEEEEEGTEETNTNNNNETNTSNTVQKLIEKLLKAITDIKKALAEEESLGGVVGKFLKILGGTLPFALIPNKAYSSEKTPYNTIEDKIHNAQVKKDKPTDPIIFDLNNDGLLETTDINNGIYFDHENDGFACEYIEHAA